MYNNIANPFVNHFLSGKSNMRFTAFLLCTYIAPRA